jgi:Bacterial Ig-like domain (group 3)/IPT/TIG domain
VDVRASFSHRRTFVVVAALVALGLAATVLPAAAADQNAAGKAGLARIGAKQRTPRAVDVRKQPHTGGIRASSHVQGEVPSKKGTGGARGGRPKVVSDVGKGHGKSKFSASAAAAATASGNFANLNSRTGATLANPGCGCEPPDTQMAAGRNEIVEFVNNDFLVYTKGGTLITSYPATDVFQPPSQTVSVTDPKILFNPIAGSNGLYYATMMVCENGGCGGGSWSHMGISLAVSTNGINWWVYDYLNDGQNLQDQEKLGFSGDKITIAVNEYGCKCGSGSQYKQENVLVLQRSDIDAALGTTYVVASFAWNTTGEREFDWMPTTPLNSSTSNNTQYVVWNQEAGSGNHMGLMRITGTPAGSNVDFSNITDISIGNATSPPAGVQPGGTIAGDKMNFQSSVVQGNQLWATGTDGCTPSYPTQDNTTRACIRLVEIDLSSDSVAYDADIGTTGTYRYNPSVVKDGAGHVFFSFTISSSTQYATAAIDGSSLPPPAVFQRIDFASGDATYTNSRWGDYSGTQQDPANTHDVWTAQEFGACAAACSSGSGNWATAIGLFTFREPQITSISPDHGPAIGGTAVDIFGAEFANGGTSVSFGGTPAASVTWFNSTHIRAVSPAHDSGVVHITATTDAGTSNTSSADQFTYNPWLTSVVPPNGPDTGGQSVTISGAGLNGTIAVSFGGTPAASFTLVNSSTVTAVTPAHAGGTVNLTVTTSGGGTSNAIPYTFQFTTTTTVTSSANPSIVGASVTFTTTVSPTPNGGTISFYDNAVPIASCQNVAVNTATGQATCTVTYGSVGSHPITAIYSGNFYYLASTSSVLTQNVTYMIVVLYDQTKVSNSGATVPIKVALQDAFGANVSSASIVVTASGLSPSPAPGTPPSGAFTFTTFDTGPGYLLNVKTKDYPAGTYTLSFIVTGDPVTHTVQFILH